MGDKTGISWTDATWNPVRGCSRVSEGCRNCYAEFQAARIVRMGRGKPTPYDGLVRFAVAPRWTGQVVFDPAKLAEPLRWRKPRRIFVNSMSDLFHEHLTNGQIAAVFGVMAATPRHTFQILTKRAKRMREWFEWLDERVEADAAKWSGRDCSVDIHTAQEQCAVFSCWDEAVRHLGSGSPNVARATGIIAGDDTPKWPLPNVWLGVSVEDRKHGVPRIDELREIPAAVRMLSCEPLLEDLGTLDLTGISMVIVGAESGPGARPMDAAWARSLRDQCRAARVAFFVKQLVVDGKLRKSIDEFPEDLRIQEFPR